MKYVIISLALAALVSTTSFGTEPQEKPPVNTVTRPDAGLQAKSPVPMPVVRLPARIAAICDNAKGDTATVCAEYETLYVQVEREKADQRRRLEELTRGGVVDTLR